MNNQIEIETSQEVCQNGSSLCCYAGMMHYILIKFCTKPSMASFMLKTYVFDSTSSLLNILNKYAYPATCVLQSAYN